MATKIFNGKYDNSQDQLYLVSKGKIYNGRYDNSTDELKIKNYLTLLNTNGKIYSGKYENSSDQIMLIKNGNIYKGNNDNSQDQIALITGDDLSQDELEKIVYLLAEYFDLI